MNRIRLKEVATGQSFFWDEADIQVPAPKIKVAERLYLDPAANGCKHPIRISAKDEDRTVYVPLDADLGRSPT